MAALADYTLEVITVLPALADQWLRWLTIHLRLLINQQMFGGIHGYTRTYE